MPDILYGTSILAFSDGSPLTICGEDEDENDSPLTNCGDDEDNDGSPLTTGGANERAIVTNTEFLSIDRYMNFKLLLLITHRTSHHD